MYYGGAELGQTVAFAGNASAFWPPAGIGVALLAALGFRYLPAILLGEALAVATAGVPLGAACLQFAGNVAEVSLGGYLLRRLFGDDAWFHRLRHLLFLIGVAALVAPISATLGVAGLSLSGVVSGDELATAWSRWALADACAIVILVPAAGVLLGRLAPPPRRSPGEIAALALVLLVVSVVGLGIVTTHPSAYLVFPPLVWIALRLQQPGASIAGVAVAAVAVAAASQGEGGFAGVSQSAALSSSQLFVSVAALTALVVAIVDSQRGREAVRRGEQSERMRRSEALLARTERLAHVGGWEWDVESGKVWWSDETYRIYGVDRTEFDVSQQSFLDRIHPDERARTGELIRDVLRRGVGWAVQRRVVWPDGTVRHVRSRGEASVGESGRTESVWGFEQDVTDLVEAERSREAAERRYRRLVERLPAVSYVAEPGADGAWDFVSPQIEEMLGYTVAEWTADPRLWRARLHPEDRDRVVEAETRALESGAPLAMEYRMITRDGREIWVRDECVVRVADDGRAHLDGLITEISERKAFESQLQYLADHDPLTGLANRRRLLDEVGLEMKVVRREQGSSTLVMLDLDNFKYVNDSLGHSAGDALIRSVAGGLAGRLRDVDTLARLGGDEFAVLLRGAGATEAEAVTGELLEQIRARPHSVGGKPVRITASAGIAGLDLAVRGPEDMLAAADVAMYDAKRRGRDRLAAFSPDLKRQIQSGQSWVERVRAALDGDGFVLYQQPIVELAGRRVWQHEILLRMRDDDGGMILPGAFLPIAERFDLVQAIDLWVVEHAVELMEGWLERGRRLRLGVNLSGRSIGDPGLLEAIENRLSGSPVHPGDLIFEVTETAAISDLERALEFSRRLGSLGCGFALDDFGSGFASFAYLKHVPVQFVKIDGEFVRGLTANPVDREVIKGMIGVARALGQRTVAEFVEDEATLELLGELGVDHAQGNHLGEPEPVDELRPIAVPEPTPAGS